MLQELIDYAAKIYWLPSLTTKYSDYNILHLPLIYRSRKLYELEMYANGFILFCTDWGRLDSGYFRLIDSACVLMEKNSYFQLLSRMIDLALIADIDHLVINQTRKVQQHLSTLVLFAEETLLKKGTAEYPILASIFRSACEAISISQLNLIFEFFSLKLGCSNVAYSSQEDGHLSYISVYRSGQRKFQEALREKDLASALSAYWNYAFLMPSDPIWTSLDHFTDLSALSPPAQIGLFSPSHIRIPEFNTSFPGPNLTSFQRALHELARHEEWRHYWQARVCRLLSIIADPVQAHEFSSFETIASYACKF